MTIDQVLSRKGDAVADIRQFK